MSALDPDVAKYRYGVVFLLVATVVVFVIIAPDGDVSRAVAFALVGAALLVSISTSRERTVVLRRRALIGGVTIVIVTLLTAFGVLPESITLAVTALMTLAVPATLGGGLLRLVRQQGATVQAVAGALAVYLLVGLAFAAAIGFAANVETGQFFTQGGGSSASDHVYYSFTVLDDDRLR